VFYAVNHFRMSETC